MAKITVEFAPMPLAPIRQRPHVDPVLWGYWALLLKHCWETKNGGYLVGARTWSSAACVRTFGGERGVFEALAAEGLVRWDGDDLIVVHYVVEAEEKHRENADRAAKAAQERWARERASRNASSSAPGNAPSIPPSNARREEREEKKEKDPPAAGSQGELIPFASGSTPPVEKAKPKRLTKEPSQAYQLREFWLDLWQRRIGTPYDWPTEKCKAWGLAKQLLAKPGGLEEVKRRAELLLGPACPKWIVDGGRDLGTLVTHWNKLAPPAPVRDRYRFDDEGELARGGGR